MVAYSYFIGIHVCKDTLDLSVVKDKRELLHLKIANDIKAIKKATTHLAKQYKDFNVTAALFCLEPTGIYNYSVLTLLASLNANVWLQSARQIQYSMGYQRGKTDRLDARLIARYAATHQGQAQLWQPVGAVLEELQALLRVRQRLLSVRQQLKVPIQELELHSSKTILKECTKLCKDSLKAINSDIAQAEQAIQELLNGDEADYFRRWYRHLYRL
jgi:transposase